MSRIVSEIFNPHAPVVQKVDLHCIPDKINLYDIPDTYPLDSAIQRLNNRDYFLIPHNTQERTLRGKIDNFFSLCLSNYIPHSSRVEQLFGRNILSRGNQDEKSRKF